MVQITIHKTTLNGFQTSLLLRFERNFVCGRFMDKTIISVQQNTAHVTSIQNDAKKTVDLACT